MKDMHRRWWAVTILLVAIMMAGSHFSWQHMQQYMDTMVGLRANSLTEAQLRSVHDRASAEFYVASGLQFGILFVAIVTALWARRRFPVIPHPQGTCIVTILIAAFTNALVFLVRVIVS